MSLRNGSVNHNRNLSIHFRYNAVVEQLDQERYSRQILFRPIGRSGQEKLALSRVAVVGCGALGSHQAAALVRAGVGELLIIDRDYVADLTAENAPQLLSDIDVLLDGTDNFETRYLLNDLSVQRGFPWIYGAAVGSYGVTMTIVPGGGPCLACVFPEPPAGMQPTCDTEGILSAAASAVASIQVAEALKLLVGDAGALHRKLISLDVWENRFQALDPGPPAEDCRVCRRREFAFLAGAGSRPVTLCGRNSVQIHEQKRSLDFAELEGKLSRHGLVRFNPFVMKFSVAPYEMTIFPDGRTIIKGTQDTAVARNLYARYIGI